MNFLQLGDLMSRKMSDRKVPFNCYLPLSQLQGLEIVSEEEGKPKAELVREAIAEYLTRKTGEKRQPQLPLTPQAE